MTRRFLSFGIQRQEARDSSLRLGGRDSSETDRRRVVPMEPLGHVG